jgi:hypothetical protein
VGFPVPTEGPTGYDTHDSDPFHVRVLNSHQISSTHNLIVNPLPSCSFAVAFKSSAHLRVSRRSHFRAINIHTRSHIQHQSPITRISLSLHFLLPTVSCVYRDDCDHGLQLVITKGSAERLPRRRLVNYYSGAYKVQGKIEITTTTTVLSSRLRRRPRWKGRGWRRGKRMAFYGCAVPFSSVCERLSPVSSTSNSSIEMPSSSDVVTHVGFAFQMAQDPPTFGVPRVIRGVRWIK